MADASPTLYRHDGNVQFLAVADISSRDQACWHVPGCSSTPVTESSLSHTHLGSSTPVTDSYHSHHLPLTWSLPGPHISLAQKLSLIICEPCPKPDDIPKLKYDMVQLWRTKRLAYFHNTYSRCFHEIIQTQMLSVMSTRSICWYASLKEPK